MLFIALIGCSFNQLCRGSLKSNSRFRLLGEEVLWLVIWPYICPEGGLTHQDRKEPELPKLKTCNSVNWHSFTCVNQLLISITLCLAEAICSLLRAATVKVNYMDKNWIFAVAWSDFMFSSLYPLPPPMYVFKSHGSLALTVRLLHWLLPTLLHSKTQCIKKTKLSMKG